MGEEERAETEGAGAGAAAAPRVSAKNLLVLTGAVLAGALLLLLAGVWLFGAYRGFRAARAEKAGKAPLLAEARSLRLTYQDAMAYPDKAAGRHALWCLRRQPGQAEAWYDGDQKKPLYIVNTVVMDAAPGGYRRDCLPSLVRITSVKPYEFSPGKLRLEAEFVAYE